MRLQKNPVNTQKSPNYLVFWRFSFGSICSKSHRNTLVYDQSVVKNVVNYTGPLERKKMDGLIA
jgi:hypothetical protein